MSLRRRYVLIFGAFSLGVTIVGGWIAWGLASAALERELDEKLLWVAGAAAAVGLSGEQVLSLEEGDERGILYEAIRARLDGLLLYVDEAHIFRRDNTVVVTTDGPDLLPIGTNLRWLEGYGPELEQGWAEGEAVTPLFRGEDGRFYKYGFLRLGETNAMLAVLMQADYLEPLQNLQRTLILAGLAATLIAAIIATGLATNVVRPLERLSRSALRIQRGRWKEPVHEESGGELGRLARAMERMRVGIVHRDEQLRLMLAQVAHEIRNPLGGLELFAAAALDTEDAEERARLLHRVRREVQALNGIIDDFLTFSRPLHPHLQLHDLREPLCEATELMEAQLIERGGTLIVDLPEEPLLARADPDHVKRIVLNLLQNGADAGSSVRLRAWWQNGEAVVAIQDDGPGVSSEMRDRIFEPFVTDKERGAGLGLAIVKQVLEANRARIFLMDPEAPGDPDDPGSPWKEGAEFRVYFQGSEDLPGGNARGTEE